MTEKDGREQGLEVVLASGSRWRQELLSRSGLRCRAVAPEVDEAAILAEDPRRTAMARARAKAAEVAGRAPGALVIGADQVLWAEGASAGEAIGKPRDPAEHLRRLKSLRGRRHELCTAVRIEAPAWLGGAEEFDVLTGVRLRADLSDEELMAYIGWGEASGCAGGYMVEGRGAWLVEGLEGDFQNVVGLPVFALIGRLRARGFRLGADGLARPASPVEP